MDSPILSVDQLRIEVAGKTLVEQISFDLLPGRCLAIVGESGSGKTLSCLTLLQLNPTSFTYPKGKVIDHQGQLQLAPKLTVLSTTLGGEYEVKLPNGDIAFLSPEQFKQYELTEDDNTDNQLEEIMNKAIENVLSKKEYIDAQATVSDENVRPIDIINGLNNKKLSDDVEKEFNKLDE
jgi:ABC-type glutathione transport system ATPase component